MADMCVIQPLSEKRAVWNHGAVSMRTDTNAMILQSCQTKDEIVKFINGVIEPETETQLAGTIQCPVKSGKHPPVFPAS